MAEEKDQTYFERILSNSADDFGNALIMYKFLLTSTIMCSEEGANAKLFKALKDRKIKAGSWPSDAQDRKVAKNNYQYLCDESAKFARKNIKENFVALSRSTILTLTAAFEKRIKDMLFIRFAANASNFNSISDFHSKDQLKAINEKVERYWSNSSFGTDFVNLKEMISSLMIDLHHLLLPFEKKYFDTFRWTIKKSSYLDKVNSISDDDWLTIKQAYLLRNSITHNRSILKNEQLNIGKQIFGISEVIDPEQGAIHRIIQSYKTVNQWLPKNPNPDFDDVLGF